MYLDMRTTLQVTTTPCEDARGSEINDMGSGQMKGVPAHIKLERQTSKDIDTKSLAFHPRY